MLVNRNYIWTNLIIEQKKCCWIDLCLNDFNKWTKKKMPMNGKYVWKILKMNTKNVDEEKLFFELFWKVKEKIIGEPKRMCERF